MKTTSNNPKPQKTWRSRLLSFSLRALLMLVLLICIGLAGYVWLLQDLHEQQAIVRELMDVVDCEVMWSHPNETSPWAGSWFIDLTGKDPNARVISIRCTPRSEEEQLVVLDAVERLPDLQILHIVGVREGFRAVPRIRKLVLTTYSYDETLTEVSRMASLEELVLLGRPNDEDIGDLENLPMLTSLVIYGDRITSDCLPAIVTLKSLEDLDLQRTRVTDHNLEMLQGLSRLRKLDLSDTEVSDASIPQLSKMKQLESLQLGSSWNPELFSPMTEEGIRQLRQALPDTQIYVGGEVVK